MKIKQKIISAAYKTKDFFQDPKTKKALKVAGIALGIILGVTGFIALAIFVPLAAAAVIGAASLTLSVILIAQLVKSMKKKPA